MCISNSLKQKNIQMFYMFKSIVINYRYYYCVSPLGGNGGEENSCQGPQSLHCVLGLRLPNKGGTLFGHDHHERRRPQVRYN